MSGLINYRKRKKASTQICERLKSYGIECVEEAPGKFMFDFVGVKKTLKGELLYYGKGNWDLTIFDHETTKVNSTSVSVIVRTVKNFICYSLGGFSLK